jgi:hypothetical protein
VSRRRSANAARACVCLLLAAVSRNSWASGVSPYLPLNLSPEIERQVERVLILADKPITSRPIATAIVLDALPAACRIDAVLCNRVRRYLNGYMHSAGLTHASVEGAAHDGAVTPLANRHGAQSDSEWLASVQAYWQPGDHLIVSLGAAGDAGDIVATGSMISAGFDFAQLDIGYRDHWLSPFTDSAMVISTEARTLPSITLSNYRPLTRFGFSYEVFLAEMERSERIRFEDGFTAGKPRLAGLRFAIEPAPGWSLSANRLFQYGGGRGGSSFSDFLDALFRPHQSDNRSDALSQDEEFGNQIAAWTSRFIFPGRTPFAVYLEYAGEDASYEGNYRLGNAALSVGITFPRLWHRFDLTYEASEWQNDWYVHGIYLDGMTNDGQVLGHWGADRRVFGDAVGAQTHMLRLGWEPSFGGLLQLQARTVANEQYGTSDYERGYDVGLSYARTLRGFTAGAEVLAGRDVFGESYSRVAGFLRFGDQWAGGGGGEGWSEDTARARGAELFADAGINFGRLQIRLGDDSPKRTEDLGIAPHFAIGARRAVSGHSDFGVRAEIDDIDGEMLLSVRALDYRYRFSNPLALSLFAGASRYDLATPAYGYYFGAGVQWRNLLRNVDLSLDFRYADKIARDKLLPSDPPSEPRPDSFYDLTGATLSLSYHW